MHSQNFATSNAFVSPLADDLAHGDPKSQKAFLKLQEEQEDGSSCSSSDLTVSVSEDDMCFLESLPNPGAKLESEDRRQASQSVYTEQQRDPPFTGYTLQTESPPDSKKESSPDSPRQ